MQDGDFSFSVCDGCGRGLFFDEWDPPHQVGTPTLCEDCHGAERHERRWWWCATCERDIPLGEGCERCGAEPCPVCAGSGFQYERCPLRGTDEWNETCDEHCVCAGHGEVRGPCEDCGGDGLAKPPPPTAY